MKLRTTIAFIGLWASLALGGAREARAEHKPFKNLKVLKDTGKQLEKGMKEMAKGLGVKCVACHKKGEYESDSVQAKLEARKFFEVVLKEKDATKREAALATLLKVLKLEKAKKPPQVWAGVDKLEKS